MKKLFQYFIFIIIHLICLPMIIVGLSIAYYKEVVASKKSGVSFTALKAIQPKWTLHNFQVRKDKDTVLFIRNLPIGSELCLWLTFLPSIITSKLVGFTPVFEMPENGKENRRNFIRMRITSFDRIVEKYSSEVEQMVLMGGGYDLRFNKYTKGKDLLVFDLDKLATQQMKLIAMERASIESDWIKYVPINFEERSWVDALIENGFDRTKKTYFHWETVSLYLDEYIVKDTLQKIAEISPAGSLIGQDFYSPEWVNGKKSKHQILEKVGEPFKYSISMGCDDEAAEENIKSLLNECGFELKDCQFAGQNSKLGKPFYAITVAENIYA